MPEPLPNNPYARPINATRSEGQMLQGEFYGERASDKKLAGHRDRKVSSANRFVGNAIAVPANMDALPEKPKRTRGPKADKVIIDEQPPEPNGQPLAAITEDDLFG